MEIRGTGVPDAKSIQSFRKEKSGNKVKSFSKTKVETHLLELSIRKLLTLVTAVGTRYLGQEAQLQQVEELVRQLEIWKRCDLVRGEPE